MREISQYGLVGPCGGTIFNTRITQLLLLGPHSLGAGQNNNWHPSVARKAAVSWSSVSALV